MPSHYLPDEYDNKGQLRLPLVFWLILLLQARTWLLFIMAGASRQQGSDLLALFYPDRQAFWIGIASGIPAALGLLLTGYRQRLPRLWQSWRWVLIVSLLASVVQQGWLAWQDDQALAASLLALVDLFAAGWLLCHRRLADCFRPDRHVE